VHGSKSTKYANHCKFFARHCAQAKCFKEARGKSVNLRHVSSSAPLAVADVSAIFGTTPFMSYQI
jgi:hypothetical protein